MAKKFRNCPSTTQNNVTYLIYKDLAIVTKTKNRNVTVPCSIKYKGKKRTVRAIWDGALLKNKQLRKIDLRANLETCEDMTLFKRDSRKVRITVHRTSDYKWLKRKGNNSIVTLK